MIGKVVEKSGVAWYNGFIKADNLPDKSEFSGERSAYCNPKSGVKGDASPLQVKGGALVAVRRNLRTKCGYSVRSTATLRAGAQLNVKKR